MGKTWLYAAAVGSGIGVWVLVSAISGEREAWDSPWYLFLGMPSICAVAAVLGYIDRTGPWRWGVLPIAAQAGWMFMTQGFGNLWPLGIAFFFVLALPPTAAAYIGAVFRR
ncbi:MAG: hypothetical protein OEV77_06255 [Nitrospira sp.]|nr:hypothetical protein [Nitrospira sp.]